MQHSSIRAWPEARDSGGDKSSPEEERQSVRAGKTPGQPRAQAEQLTLTPRALYGMRKCESERGRGPTM